MTTVTSSGLSQDQPQDKKFLRPTSLPLRPGTYTPKRHVSLPPQASLISPETPRPRKAYVQLYLNGHAYTYLGLKCSTRMFFCTLNKPQPIYVPLSPEHNKVSMYSNWKVCSESNPNPFGLNPGSAMGHYDSRNRASCYTVANGNRQDVMTHSSYFLQKYETGTGPGNGVGDGGENNPRRVRVCDGGFESNEDYTYVRGRGRGRYVCEECGIRCKKPSMLKKHIRTHTNLRPYSCKHCAFSFKTKGNLTKHMKSKAHYKKCVELDVPPDLIGIEDEANNLPDEDSSSQNTQDLGHEGSGSGGGVDSEDETEDEDDDEDEDEDTEEEGKMRVAARSLLSLSEVTPQIVRRQFVSAGLDSGRPSTYPYILSSKEQHIPHDSADAPKLPHSADVSAVTSKLSEVTIVTPGMTTPTLDSGRPIDLSSKATAGTPVITAVSGQASLLATICSTTERLPALVGATTPTEIASNDTNLLHRYLKERAARESLIKRQQCCPPSQEPVPIGASLLPSLQLLHRYLKKRSAELANKPETSVETSSPAPVSPPPPPLLEIVCGTSPTGVLHTPSQQPLSPNKKLKAEFMPPSSGPSPSYVSIMEDGRSMCSICNKVFNKPSQLRLHVNIHYFERPFRCESCAVSFRTKGHLQKHQRSVSHLNKVNMNSTFGAPTTSNPRPFKCDDCKIAFRIHGHLAKHLRSKMHIMKLECLGKLPFGIYAELERSGTNMNDIDTTDCENSLESLQKLAQKLYEKDPSKLGQWTPIEPTAVSCPGGGGTSGGDTDDDDDDRGGNARPPPALQHNLPPRGRFDDGYHHPHHQEDGVR
ncbi:hypothetical protein AAG570_002656 [Ranatra chinensis]|uniref:C2H2-type domain-containing protein n=1 Tax=Ranatra chinensis TaxID=642074 RepID=A0ABD0Y8A0_9HEMI